MNVGIVANFAKFRKNSDIDTKIIYRIIILELLSPNFTQCGVRSS